MSKDNRTPGPWRFANLHWGYQVINSGRYQCVIVARPFDEGNQERDTADFRLIAAAPELLEACQAFVTAYEKSLQLEKTDTALRLAKAAIAKANGEQIK